MTSADMVQNKLSRRDFIKLLGATTILLLGFLRKCENIGETSDSQYFQDYINQTDSNDTSGDTSPIQNTHNSASTASFEDTCSSKPYLCKTLDFIGNFSTYEKSKYAEDEIRITNFIDTKNTINSDFTSTLKNLDINKEEGNRRGYATRDSIVLNIGNVDSNTEFHQLSCHELGHIFDLGFLQGDANTKDITYTEFKKPAFTTDDPSLAYYKISRKNESTRKSTAKSKDFCSGYGMSDPFEDFAECFNLYLNHNALFKMIAKENAPLSKKYNFIATFFQGKYINKSLANLTLIKTSTNRRTRDTTKIDIN